MKLRQCAGTLNHYLLIKQLIQRPAMIVKQTTCWLQLGELRGDNSPDAVGVAPPPLSLAAACSDAPTWAVVSSASVAMPSSLHWFSDCWWCRLFTVESPAYRKWNLQRVNSPLVAVLRRLYSYWRAAPPT